MEKTFYGDLIKFKNKLINKEKFSFSKYADGEWAILQGRRIGNNEFQYDTSDVFFREKLWESFKFKHLQYIVGIGCECCMGKSFYDMKDQSTQNDENLTWANIWVNSNYPHYIKEIVPLYNDFDVVLICNENASLQNLPFKTMKDFRVQNNAWFYNYSLVDEIKLYITENQIKDCLFLFCAGPFGNILSHQLFEHNQENTYLDIGSTLDPFLFGQNGKTRGYLRGSGTEGKTCIWPTPSS